MNNTTVLVASMFECGTTEGVTTKSSALMRETSIGCEVLLLLQQIYQFRLTYDSRGADANITEYERRRLLYPDVKSAVDVYARPMALKQFLDYAAALEVIFVWRFGFILLRDDLGLFHSFYSKPFSAWVWHSLGLIAILISVQLYILNVWETRMYGPEVASEGEVGYLYDLFVTAAAFTQHYQLVRPKLVSRRTAYLFFFLFSDIMYMFYTSNLLSHLVSDRDNTFNLDTLADSEYKCVVVDSMTMAVEGPVASYAKNIMQKKFATLVSADLQQGVEAVRTLKVALLSDYMSAYPYINQKFVDEEICQLVEVDLYRNIKKFLFTSKGFLYKEQFKIGILRIREAGILRRVTQKMSHAPPSCVAKPQVPTQLVHIIVPLAILACAYIMALVILALEKIVYARNKYFPYID